MDQIKTFVDQQIAHYLRQMQSGQAELLEYPNPLAGKILILSADGLGPAVIITTAFVPTSASEEVAVSEPLGSYTNTGAQVRYTISLNIPEPFKDINVTNALYEAPDFQWFFLTGSKNNYVRTPDQGYIQGTLEDLAAEISELLSN